MLKAIPRSKVTAVPSPSLSLVSCPSPSHSSPVQSSFCPNRTPISYLVPPHSYSPLPPLPTSLSSTPSPVPPRFAPPVQTRKYSLKVQKPRGTSSICNVFFPKTGSAQLTRLLTSRADDIAMRKSNSRRIETRKATTTTNTTTTTITTTTTTITITTSTHSSNTTISTTTTTTTTTTHRSYHHHHH
ncbi:hypothetical protein E2C01_015737 [Portunus trituberculatus]|uniref:Uncharacterized protein n=1 Tax=Portunus trituberculatus TaxID=210409 RepID=A0A5B7DP67_PORTR|nr:hypothetical protein [Portunus trituberculatus]